MYEPPKKPEGVEEYDGYAADIGKPLTPERKAFLEEQHKKYQEYLKSREARKGADKKEDKKAV